MICPRCQAAMADNVVFCTTCGTAVGAAEQPPAGSSSTTRPAQPGYAPQGQPSHSQPAQPGYAQPGQPGYRQPAQPGYPPQGQAGYQQPGYSPHGQPGYGPPGQPGYFPPAPHATPAFAFDLKRLSGAEQVIGGACVVLIITLFLPWFGISGGGISVTASGFSVHGYLVVALLTAVALIAYLVMRAGWADPPVKLPVADMPLLLATTGLQLLIVLIAFLVKPAFTSWQFGAYLGLLAALAACAAAAVPAIGSMQGSRPGS